MLRRLISPERIGCMIGCIGMIIFTWQFLHMPLATFSIALILGVPLSFTLGGFLSPNYKITEEKV